jgi:hypothetical protein
MVATTSRLVRLPRMRDVALLFVLGLVAASLFCSGSRSEAAAPGVEIHI